MTEPDGYLEQAPRFAADAMLGRLARYLRFLGYDTSYRPHIEDALIVSEAIAEGRVLLTRDRALVRERKVRQALLIESESALAQLREVAIAFDLEGRTERTFRCTRCNAILECADKEALTGRVPSRVLASHDRFERCPVCARIYWQGSHVARLRARIARALEDGRSLSE